MAADTTTFSDKKGLVPQLEIPNPASYMPNKETPKG